MMVEMPKWCYLLGDEWHESEEKEVREMVFLVKTEEEDPGIAGILRPPPKPGG